MPARAGFFLLLTLAVTLAAACSLGSDDPLEPLPVTVQGTVTAAPEGTPIPGAMVFLGSGGHFTFGVVLDSVTTGAEGRYRIEHEGLHNPESGCQLWLSARVPGCELVPGGWQDGLYGVDCTEGLQTVDVQMRRVSTPPLLPGGLHALRSCPVTPPFRTAAPGFLQQPPEYAKEAT